MSLVKYSFTIAGKSPEQQRKDKIDRLAAEMCEMPQIDMPVKHHFASHMYARELFIPANSALIGAIHKDTHFCVLLKGRLVFETGGEPEVMEAPHFFTAQAYSQKAAFSPVDSVFITYHATDETDPEKLIPLLTTSNADEVAGGAKNIQLLRNKEIAMSKEVLT